MKKRWEAFIKDEKTGMYLEQYDSYGVAFGDFNDALVFYEKKDAENVLDALNAEHPGIYVLYQ